MATIKSIQFGVLSAETFRQLAVCEITHPEPFNKAGKILEEGPCDLRLGAFDRYLCKTCGLGYECPGHFGFLQLCVPVYNVNLIDRVKDILDILCLRCSAIKLPTEEKEKLLKKHKSRDNVELLKKLAKAKIKCPSPSCGQNCSSVTMSGAYIEVTEAGVAGATKNNLFARRALTIFENMPEADVKLLNLPYAPKDLLFTVFPILPNPERPTYDKFESGHQRSVDKLTFKIRDIIIQNRKLIKMMEEETNMIKRESQELMLQDEVTLFYTNNYVEGSHSHKKNMGSSHGRAGGIDEGKPLHTRLKGKDGQLRGNLMGKRVNLSARTVITGDPTLDLNQVRIPKEIATNLTIKERVSSLNLVLLQKLVLDGMARSIQKLNDGGINGQMYQPDATVDLRFYNTLKAQNRVDENSGLLKNLQLRYGDIVERYLRDGDYVIFNRQPTLHRMSLMAMKVKIGNTKTFGMNV